MLNPNTRSLYTAALTPPPGMVFDEAICTTFSLDPAVLLSVPVHLALLGPDSGGELMDGIAVLEAVRRLSERITVYAQRGRLQVPSPAHVLYGLLESMVVEVTAPRGGVFHPKLWVMRFVDPDKEDSVLLRLLVLSRNLTADRSWDLALSLEGKPKGGRRAANRPLGELISQLPSLAFNEVASRRIEQANRLAEEVRRCNWQLPPGFVTLNFSVLGLTGQRWAPKPSKRLAVISPFCGEQALAMLAGTSRQPATLISRPETFAELSEPTLSTFAPCLILHEAAETEDGEDPEPTSERDTHGLHAKAYILESGWDTHVILGSANATDAALIGGQNVEVLAKLVGKRSQVGGIDALLGAEGLGEIMVEYQSPQQTDAPDPERQAAEQALEAARNALAAARLLIQCAPAPATDDWQLHLIGTLPPMDGLSTARVWPITVSDSHAIELASGTEQAQHALGHFAAASITGLIAIELHAAAWDLRARFVLNLPVAGLPPARDAAVMRLVVSNREGFLRYLLLMLGDLGASAMPADLTTAFGSGTWNAAGSTAMPLLEELVRAFTRDPARLREVRRGIERLTEADDANAIIPEDFLETWHIFERAMEQSHD